MKHVFSKGYGSLFEVSLSREPNGHYQLVIRDDGPGISATAKATPNHSLGMGIMESFAMQLGGSLQFSDISPGTTLTLSFKARR